MESKNNRASTRRKIWQPTGTWIFIRKTAQYIFLLAFVGLFISARWDGADGDFLSLPMRLDPLLVLSAVLSSRTFLVVYSLSLITIVLTILFGRAWCGWICPLGTVLDLASLRRWRSKSGKPPRESLRGVKYFLMLTILLAALFSNLTLTILDPLTILMRTLTVSIWPVLNLVITSLERMLYRVSILSNLVYAVDFKLRPVILPAEPIEYQGAIFIATVFAGIILLNLIAERFWCRYLCLLGGLLGVISKFAIFRREVSDNCKGCTLCEQSCPTGTIDPGKNYASDPAECTMCLNCLEACPRSGINFVPRLVPGEWQSYDPNRRKALYALVTAAVGAALFESAPPVFRHHPHLLRPPGSSNQEILDRCVRCSECMRVCPTGALQPALLEMGLEGIWTPVLTPRTGYCDYSCNTCGSVCPVEAIPPLDLDTKRQQVIGKAYIDTKRCIAWADHIDCIVCEEMCPIPEKAIHLQERSFSSENSESRIVQLPEVDRELCIGCGICEYKCPVDGEAAIRVFASNVVELPV